MTSTEARIGRLEEFKGLVLLWQRTHDAEVRTQINQKKHRVRQEIIEAGCFKTLTIGPPAAIGGLVMNNVDPIEMMFDPPWRVDLVSVVVDMIDSTIGAIREGRTASGAAKSAPTVKSQTMPNYAFIAMPIDPARPELDDVLDALKEAAQKCGIQAERVDEPQTNARITDRILESIERAEFVIADLTDERPNVYYEAGYAHALGKVPIYIARKGTTIHFDLKDYPVIFFTGLRGLKDAVENRLRGLAANRAS